MKGYLETLEHIMKNGVESEDRTGVGTKSIFGVQTRYNLRDGFPAVTTKRLAWKSVVSELLWFLEGSTDERRLAEIHYGKPREELVGKGTIWTANADRQGVDLGYTNTETHKELGPVYGAQMRGNCDNGIDQIENVVYDIRNNPTSRRIILSNWNVADIEDMALPPCHTMAQFYVRDNELSCQLYQRSADMFLGVPFNIASYSLLVHMIADHTGIGVGDFVHTIGDAHIYKNHYDAVTEQLNRSPGKLPKLVMPKIESLECGYIETLKPSDFKLEGYEPQETIKAEMAV